MLKVWSTNKIAMDIKKKRSKNIEMSRELIGCRLMKFVRVGWWNFKIKLMLKVLSTNKIAMDI